MSKAITPIIKNGKAYYVTMGLEIHAEMKTQSKMWCSCANVPLERAPNKNTCPVCMAHPGTLPVPNAQAIQNVIKVGLAMNANIANFTEFDRKNYFYPDIPKGYQISQYKHPIVSGGSLAGVDITRIHLEEDTAKSTHDTHDNTLVDFNRAGVPLMELVTEPCIHDAETAVNFAKELQLLLRYLDVSDADMEKGQMRIEVNLSVSTDPEKFGTKVEVKNINSFKAVENSIVSEIARHIEALESGEKIVQETRGYIEATGKTKSQRIKENSAEYRYFPDPDITKFYLHDDPRFNPETLKKELPELPTQRRSRLADAGVKSDYVDLFVTQPVLGNYFDAVAKNNSQLTNISSNYIGSDLASILKGVETDEEKLAMLPKAEYFAELMELLNTEKISSRAGKDLLNMMVENKKAGNEVSPTQLATEKNLLQISDEAILLPLVHEVLNTPNNAKSIADYKSGKEAALMSLVGQVIRNTSGRANPTITKEIFVKNL
jgi:aspartyl-tRNA(Asn)/glutamyl-tRNA(Gln) amidotransferase subunit B